MAQPPLPLALPPKPSVPGEYEKTEGGNLPFVTVQADYATDLLRGRHNGEVPQVPLPLYTEWLPNAKIKELIEDRELQKGYVLSAFADDFKHIRAEVNKVKESQSHAAAELKNRYADEKDGVIKKAESLAVGVSQYHAKMVEYDTAQIEMYNALNGLSKRSIADRYLRQASENESTCEQLLNDISSKDSLLLGDELESVVDKYLDLRYQWHQNKEYASEILHGKIEGIP